MNEALLQWIWRYQQFNIAKLCTTDGDSLSIYKPGNYNTHSGPDFLQARLTIGYIEWNGHVEIHVRSSQWTAHHHENDSAYDNVVLHVVWVNDAPTHRTDGSTVPTLVLQSHVDASLLQTYKQLMQSGQKIPCHSLFNQTTSLVRYSALEQAWMERLERKSEWVTTRLKENNQDWEETAYQLLAYTMGLKINSESFLTLAKGLPYKLLKKHRNNLLQIEALLFGQAGFLPAGSSDAYRAKLYQEYSFLQKKYTLQPATTFSQWKFMRLRPAGFPTLRIAHFATILHASPHLFSTQLEMTKLKEITQFFEAPVSPYWHSHFRFGKESKKTVPGLGESFIALFIINALTPLWSAYGKERDDDSFIDKAVTLLQTLPPENNVITRTYKTLDWKAKNAFDSQGMIELHNEYCIKKNCLNCAVGVEILAKKK